MMDLIHVTCQHAISGIGRYGIELTRALKGSYPELIWYKPYRSDHADAYLHQEFSWIKGYPYRSFRNAHPYVLPFYIKRALPSKDRTIYHAHWFLSGLAASFTKPENTIITMHDVSLLHVSEADPLYTWWYENALNRFKNKKIPIIVVSEQAKADTITYARYPEELVHTIYNGIDHQRFYPLDEKTNRKNKNTFRIIYCGGLGERKNVGLLLKAYQHIEQKYDYETELIIAGAHPDKTKWPKLAKKLKLQTVEFTGFLPDEQMNAFYNSGDVMVFPSLYEGFGFSPLESMAAGTPVLSARGGSLEEISGGGAMLFDYSVVDLTEKMITVIDKDGLRGKLRNKGITWSKNYNWTETANTTKNLYNHYFH